MKKIEWLCYECSRVNSDKYNACYSCGKPRNLVNHPKTKTSEEEEYDEALIEQAIGEAIALEAQRLSQSAQSPSPS